MEAVEVLELLIAVAFDGEPLWRLGGGGQRECHGFHLPVGRIRGGTSNGFVHALVARDATVKPGNVAEIVVERELRQPDLIDPQRSIESIQHRQFEQALADIGSPVLEGLRQLIELGAVVGESLGRCILACSQLLQSGLERLAMGVRRLEIEGRSGDLRPLGVCQGEQRHQLVL